MPYRRSYKRRRTTRPTRRYRRKRGTTSKRGSRRRYAKRGTAGMKRRAVTRAYRANLPAAIPMAIPNRAPLSQFRKIEWTDSLTISPATNPGTIKNSGLLGFWIRADRPSMVYKDGTYLNWTDKTTAVLSANTNFFDPTGENANCQQLFSKFERARVLWAKLTVVATPLVATDVGGGDNTYVWADEANVYLTLDAFPWAHTNGLVGTAFHPDYNDFDKQHNMRHARNTKATRTRIQNGAARRGAIMSGYYSPTRLQPAVAYLGTSHEFATGGAPSTVGAPSNTAYWNIMCMPGGGVFEQASDQLYTGVVRPHRFDIKVEYMVQFWERVDTLEADRFQTNAPAAP
jgi:hypothetical protein